MNKMIIAFLYLFIKKRILIAEANRKCYCFTVPNFLQFLKINLGLVFYNT